MKNLIKNIIPPILLRKISGFFYGWRGDYKDWQTAQNKSSGYDGEQILQKVLNATLKVKNGEAAYERDSVTFDESEYAFPVVSALLWIAIQNNNQLNLIDFGGSLGSSYFQNKKFLDTLVKVNWSIVEQKHFIDCGKQYFENEELHFFESIEHCLSEQNADTILLSSVLQYIEKPYQLLDVILQMKIKYIIIDRTPFLQNRNDRITVQKVHPKIYKATYPCWFFNEQKFKDYFAPNYELFAEFNALDKANFASQFKGFIFKRKENA